MGILATTHIFAGGGAGAAETVWGLSYKAGNDVGPVLHPCSLSLSASHSVCQLIITENWQRALVVGATWHPEHSIPASAVPQAVSPAQFPGH